VHQVLPQRRSSRRTVGDAPSTSAHRHWELGFADYWTKLDVLETVIAKSWHLWADGMRSPNSSRGKLSS
jgi:hypothetical protein